MPDLGRCRHGKGYRDAIGAGLRPDAANIGEPARPYPSKVDPGGALEGDRGDTANLFEGIRNLARPIEDDAGVIGVPARAHANNRQIRGSPGSGFGVGWGGGFGLGLGFLFRFGFIGGGRGLVGKLDDDGPAGIVTVGVKIAFQVKNDTLPVVAWSHGGDVFAKRTGDPSERRLYGTTKPDRQAPVPERRFVADG